ncbi:ATP-dependent helicase [Humisphaera borealis]|uniref:DNA 3'-5' helicase n=1 Tax=Humisphaera borealis TaxID=2807512 RepID=A0A7M2WZH9_9BACT|nr:ATP-dependent helicase [Humisphaera borealis]QOV90875.1 ATP-dependent helicase [Humisphaera borealis]
MKLNPEQEQVAGHVTGRILALAGPGSGKTRTLTERTGRLIRGGVDAGAILCLTFTNKARDEMRQRIAGSFGQAANAVFISNFHGLCGILLRKFGRPLGYEPRLTVIDSDDQIDLILQIARKKGIEASKPQARLLATLANDWRENLGDDDALEELASGRASHEETNIVRDYVRLIRERGQVDFSGMLSETARLLRSEGLVQDKLQRKFRFIQVDEYQDTNRAQNEIVELIAGKDDNVLAVGDMDQSIYEWRGASPDSIPRFIEKGRHKTGSCKVVKLGVNYRSTPQIVEVADRLIRHCLDRIEVPFSAIRPPGELPKCVGVETPDHEADAISQNIQKEIREGTQAAEIAVFYRANDMSRAVEQALTRRQIPYTVVGGGSYYDRLEIKDVLAMLRFVCNPKDGISFARIANKPTRGMGDTLIGRLESWAEQQAADLLTALRRAPEITDEHGKPLGDAALRACGAVLDIFSIGSSGRSVWSIADDLVTRSRYDDFLKERYGEKASKSAPPTATPEYEERKRNVTELLNSIAVYCRDHPRADLADYLQSISLYTDSDKADDARSVRLMSLHASKGLEFEVVYLIGCEEGILPHHKAVSDRPERGLDEERRLCYVGFTRAKKTLRVTWCKKRQDVTSRSAAGKFKASRPSRFLAEAGLLSAAEFEAAVAEARTAGGPVRTHRSKG